MAATRSAGSFWKTVITKVPRLPLPITPRLIWSEGAAWAASMVPPASKNFLLFMTLLKTQLLFLRPAVAADSPEVTPHGEGDLFPADGEGLLALAHAAQRNIQNA